MSSFDNQNPAFLAKAEAEMPTLKRTVQDPQSTIRVVADDSRPLGWRSEVDEGGFGRLLTDNDSIIVDFGGHRVGELEFDLVGVGNEGQEPDSPARLKVTFGEVLNDVAESFEPYTGKLSKAWLPVEFVTIDFLPQRYRMPRRWAFRFVKIEIVAVSCNFKVRFENMNAIALTSGPVEDPEALSFPGKWASMAEQDKELFRTIDRAACQTLRDCMQTIYEDGPRRDMRLWIGDLRLQALTSYTIFKDYQIAKRCLYLHAGTPFHDGRIAAGMFDKPKVHRSGNFIFDYSLLFCCSLLEYIEASGDDETGRDLYESALKQFEFSLVNLNAEGILEGANAAGFSELDPQKWHFIDWKEGLDKNTSAHAVIIFALRSLAALERRLSIPTSQHFISGHSGKSSLGPSELADQMVIVARKTFFCPKKGLYVSGKDRQVSLASQAWAVLAGIPESQEQAQRALKTAYEDKTALTPSTPYGHHYLVDALITAGLDELALSHIKLYWGSMIHAGADTFWEAWDPEQPRAIGPYNDFHLMSFCHAWSCGPALHLRQLGL